MMWFAGRLEVCCHATSIDWAFKGSDILEVEDHGALYFCSGSFATVRFSPGVMQCVLLSFQNNSGTMVQSHPLPHPLHPLATIQL